jgi:Putative OmpA-OmpF-like porin family
MKKLIVAAVAVFTLGANAQDFKPTTGDLSVEFGVTGGIMNTSFNLADQGFGSGPMFKARYFKAENFAYRATIVLANSTDKTIPAVNVENTVSNFGIGIGFGFEKHFKGTEKLSPYWGADAMIGYRSNGTENVNSATNVTRETTSSAFRVGARGVFGADYYFAKKLYVGIEAGLGMYFVSEGDTKTTLTGSPDVTAEGGNSLNISPELITGVRLGFVF